MRPRVELIYDQACPNVEQARAALLHAFAEAKLPPTWTEWDSHAPDAPAHARSFGSPISVAWTPKSLARGVPSK